MKVTFEVEVDREKMIEHIRDEMVGDYDADLEAMPDNELAQMIVSSEVSSNLQYANPGVQVKSDIIVE